MEGAQVPGADRLIDSFGRRISYVRLSVTDRCDLRCRYCMAEQMDFLPRAELLSSRRSSSSPTSSSPAA